MNTVQLNQSYTKIHEAIIINDSATVQNNVQQITHHASLNQIKQILSHQMSDGTTLIRLANGNQANAEQKFSEAIQDVQNYQKGGAAVVKLATGQPIPVQKRCEYAQQGLTQANHIVQSLKNLQNSQTM